MATSRTGTATWKRIVKAAKRQAQSNGQTRCPYCRVILDYIQGLLPHSAEGDHIVSHKRGGQDTLQNCQIICRRCNQSKGERDRPKASTVLATKPLKTSRRW